MAKYSIPEVNLPKLENEMKALENKIKKYGGNFSYKVLGEHFETVEVYGEMKNVLFFDIEVDGELKFNDWEYCASIENTDEGNIIVSKDGGHEIPEKYYYSAPQCDHCGSNRYRRYTFIIRNAKTGDYKQVGKACLEDYTCGLSAAAIARLAEFFKNLEKISKDRSNEIYYENTEKLLISLQAYLDSKRIRYYKELDYEFDNDYDGSYDLRARYTGFGYNYYQPCKNTWTPKKVNCGYTPKNFYNAFIKNNIEILEEKTKLYAARLNEARVWFDNQEDNRGNDFHNYKTLIKQEEIPFEDVGILCNGFIEYLSEYRIEETLAKASVIREAYKVRHDEKIMDIINELKKYSVDGSLNNKFGIVTLVKRIDIGSDTFYVDNNNNLCYIPSYRLPAGIGDQVFIAKNIEFYKSENDYSHNVFNKDLDTKVAYYELCEVKNRAYTLITEYMNTVDEVYQIFDTKEEITGEEKLPDRIEEFYGNINDTITVELVTGLRYAATSYKGATLYDGLDNSGRCFAFWSRKQLDKNVPVKITGKIWKHNEYRSAKSTILNIENIEII